MGWLGERRFVSMRIPGKKSGKGGTQLELLEDGDFTYREFVTNHSGKSHQAISEYDKRADCENQIGEVKREGLSAISTASLFTAGYFRKCLVDLQRWRSSKNSRNKRVAS